MKDHERLFPVLSLARIFVGAVFVASGFEKLLFPYQNFYYVVENYDLLSPFWTMCVARVFPWIEYLTGVFLVFGLWIRLAARSAIIIYLVFLFVVGQAILRRLPLDSCGCFGDMVSVPLTVIFIFDMVLLALAWMIHRSPAGSRVFGLDRFYQSG